MRSFFLLTLVGAIGLSGCVTRAPKTEEPVKNAAAVKDLRSFHLSENKESEVSDPELNAIPTEVNPTVEKWITYFQGRGRRHMERYLARSTRYEKLMKKVLSENGLPEDLFYIALIESGFSSAATSHASAVGYWQFIRGTGKRYGLEISRLVDERRDPVLATQAAAEYFKGLYSVFGSWYLAMASYNVGENRVKREVMKHGTRDFWELARKARLPAETVNYVPKFIAAKLIGKDPAKYGFEGLDYLPPIEYDTIVLDQPVNLRVMAEKMSVNYEDFKALNPRYKGEIAPLRDNKIDLRIPVGQGDLARQVAKESVADKVEFVADVDTQIYRVRSGDNLSSIARRFRTSVAYIRDMNDLPRGKSLRVGQRLYVPDRTPVSGRKTKNVAQEDSKAQREPVSVQGARFHVVQNGDNLYTIARKYGTTVQELSRLNNLRRGRVLRVGTRLKLPADDNSSSENRSASSSRRAASRRLASSPKIHVVRRGENLSAIAERYNIAISDLKVKNKITNPSMVMAGARLVIPLAQAQD